MVDRRSLMVGGAAAAALATVAGKAPASAASAHTQRVVASLDVRKGLVGLDLARERLARGVREFEASEPRDARADDLHAWIQLRVTELTGKTDPFDTVVTELEQTRVIMAFAFAVHTQHQDLAPPVIAASMPVPAILTRLEPGFFADLALQIELEARNSPAFADLILASTSEMDRTIAALAGEPGLAGLGVAAAKKPGRWRTIGTVMLFTFFIMAQGSYSC